MYYNTVSGLGSCPVVSLLLVSLLQMLYTEKFKKNDKAVPQHMYGVAGGEKL
jgi:hypothetical protein